MPKYSQEKKRDPFSLSEVRAASLCKITNELFGKQRQGNLKEK